MSNVFSVITVGLPIFLLFIIFNYISNFGRIRQMENNFSQALLIQGFAAFTGAFFAYFFLRVGEFFSKVYQRQVKHYNSLVNLEVQLNEIGGIVNDNLYILPEFRRVIVSGGIYYNNLHQILIDKTHYENLHDLVLLNELFSYNHKIRKINNDIKTTGLGYQDMKNAWVQKHIDKPTYVVNTKRLAGNLSGIEIFLGDLQKHTIRLMARTRVQMRGDIPLGVKLQRFFIKSVGPNIKDDDVKKEIRKIEKELKESGEESRREIEQMLKKSKGK